MLISKIDVTWADSGAKCPILDVKMVKLLKTWKKHTKIDKNCVYTHKKSSVCGT